MLPCETYMPLGDSVLFGALLHVLHLTCDVVYPCCCCIHICTWNTYSHSHIVYLQCVWCCVYAGSSMEFETEADSTDKSQPFEIKTGDITEHDDKLRPHLCTVCDKRFTQKGNLMKHKQMHSLENVYSCSVCKERLPSQSALCKHKNIHSGKHKCSECGRCCGSYSDLARHRQTHSGEKPFECSVCSTRFTQAGSLATHSRIHSGEELYKCHMCDKAFSEYGHLNTHMRVHTGEKPYKCSLCDKSFSHFGQLQSHIRQVHSMRRPYHCPYCRKTFKAEGHLKRHAHIHTVAKPYLCRLCSQRFVRLVLLQIHLLKSHNEGTDTWFTVCVTFVRNVLYVVCCYLTLCK